jgi:endoglucanase
MMWAFTDPCARSATLRVLVVVLTMALVACSAGDKSRSKAPAGIGPMDLGGCSRAAVIDDGEDGDHQVLVHEDRNGYIYTFADDEGTTVDPPRGKDGGTFAYAEGGANGSMYGARARGKVTGGQVVFAGIGVNFVDPKGMYDASAYEGITFFARRSATSPKSIRLKVPDVSTDPDGGKCTECFNDFGADIELQENWQQYKVAFEQMSQMPGWGNPRPSSIDPSQVFGVQFQVTTPGADFELWVDDLTFYGCNAP